MNPIHASLDAQDRGANAVSRETFSHIRVSDVSTAQPTAVSEFRQSWRILTASFLGMLFCYVPFSAIGVLITPWAHDNGWSLSAISGFAIFLGVGSAISEPMNGWLMDRCGARSVALAYVPVSALAVAGTALIGHSVWTLYFAMFMWGFINAGNDSYIRTVNTCFVRARGAAIGLMFVGNGLSGAIGAPLAQWIVDRCGWRLGLIYLSGIALLPWPVVFAWLHEKGEDHGRSSTPLVQLGYTGREALRTRVFWLLGSALFLSAMAGGGGVFLIPFLSENGMSRAAAASCAAISGVSATIAQPIFGILVDRLHVSAVAAAASLVFASALIIFGLFGTKYAILAVTMIGIAGSAGLSCTDCSASRYFGLKSFGQIWGLFSLAGSLGGMAGPPIFSLLRDATGTYKTPYIVMGMLAGSAAICVTLTRRYPFFSGVSSSGSHHGGLSLVR